MKDFGDIVSVFSYLSLLTVGGGLAAFPALKSLTVDTYHWLTFPELLHFYSLGQLAPGPNMMMVASVGMKVAGPLGALTALVCFLTPTSVATFAVGRLWDRLQHWRWRPAIQHGLGSVSVGLVAAGCIIMGKGAINNTATAVIALLSFILLLRSKINPAWPILASGVIGVGLYYLGWIKVAAG